MRPRFVLVVFSVLLFVTVLACGLLDAPEAFPEIIPDDSYMLTPSSVETQEGGAVPASCPAVTDRIVELNSGAAGEGAGSMSDLNLRDEEEDINIATYVVNGDEIYDPQFDSVPEDLQDEQDDTAKHEEIWNYFTTLIPYDYRQSIVEYAIVTDGPDNVLASVAQSYEPDLWALYVDIADTEDYYYLTFTLVHEFAHLLTLGPDQVTPSEAIFNNPDDEDIYFQEVSTCDNFFPGEGCANADSYINAFYDQFWADKYEEWNQINLIEDEDEYYAQLDEFYYKYEDQFLTDYAATNPAEDIAESFAFFVFSEEPIRDSLAGDKILFFYNYTELVDLRGQILNNLCASFP